MTGASLRFANSEAGINQNAIVKNPRQLRVCQLCAVDFSLKKFLLPLIDGMTLCGWRVTSVCSSGKDVGGLRAAGYRVETIPIARSLNPFLALRSIMLLTLFFRRERFHVVHVHTPVAALLGRMAAAISGVPLVIYTAHGFYFHENMPGWKRSFFVLLEKLAGRLTHLLFSQSAEDAQDAVREGIVPAERVLAIGNGVDPAIFDPSLFTNRKAVREDLGIPDNAFVVGMIGRQVKEKGVVEFLRAATIIAEKNPRLHVLLVGDRLPSDHAADVDAELAEARLALGEKLITTGMREDIPSLLSVMDVFCMPSYREGMPRTIIEAMMMSKPVVATDIRGSREEVVHEQTGLIVPLRDIPALATAMQRMAEAPEWALSLGAAGRKRALELYDERNVVNLQIDRIGKAARASGLCG
jgi:glycosyltransferase involved in cell wall biosynthesis